MVHRMSPASELWQAAAAARTAVERRGVRKSTIIEYRDQKYRNAGISRYLDVISVSIPEFEEILTNVPKDDELKNGSPWPLEKAKWASILCLFRKSYHTDVL